MRRAPVLAGLAGFLLRSASADAVLIDFAPSAQTVTAGAAVGVDIVVSGLGDLSEPSLGTFDLDLSYDPSVLSVVSVTLTPLLGDVSLGEAVEVVDLATAGLVDLLLLSLLSPAELDSLQPESFVLATLSFDALAPGTSALALTQVLLGDAFGADLDATTGTGAITVSIDGTPVPEPTLAGFLLAAVLGLVAARRRIRGGS
jgi:hypothetical protein